jgi:nucleoside-diphosphate-sugar epimerase
LHLVIGGSGTVGRYLVEALRAEAGLRVWDGGGDLDSAMAGVDVVYVCTPAANPTVNLRGASAPAPHVVAVAEAAARARVRRLIRLSTTQVYGHPGEAAFTESSPPRPAGRLGRLARQEERWLLESGLGLEVVMLRAAQLFGPGEPLTGILDEEIQAGIIRLPGRGLARRSFIHPADAARALQAAAQRGRPGQVYLAAGFTDCWHALCQELATSRRLPLRLGSLPYGVAYGLGVAMEWLTKPGTPCWPNSEVVAMLGEAHLVDDSASRRALTWSPRIGSFLDGRGYMPAGVAAPARPRARPARLAVSARRGRSRS